MIFISYAWINNKPDNCILEFVAKLRELGYNAICDVMLISQRTSINFKQMMAENMKKADKVIIILSEKYKAKADSFIGGVGDEYRYILEDIDIHTRKYLICTYCDLSNKTIIENIVPEFLRGRELLHIKRDIEKIIYYLNDVDKPSFPEYNNIVNMNPTVFKGHTQSKIYICEDEILENIKNENNSKKMIKLLDEKLQSFVENYKCQKRLIPLIKNALLMDRETRREVHVIILETNDEMRRQFLRCMEELIDFPNETVRGEAYYCLGELTDDRNNINEEFIVRGLYDESYFVKACCANVLHHYIPLKENTLNLLKDEIILSESAHANTNRKKLYYYAKRTLKIHYDYLKLII